MIARLNTLLNLLVIALAIGVQGAPVSGQDSTQGADAADAARPPRGMFATVVAGAGVGARSVSIPSRRSDRRLSTGLFPALQLALHGELALRRRVLFGALVAYETSVGLRAASIAPRSGNSVDGAELRANSLTLGLLPGYRFGGPRESTTLRVLLGWGFRSLHTVVDLETPSYSLHGPTLRPELSVPLSHGLVRLRFAPELQLLVGASQGLVDLSNASLPGLSFGGEASIDVRLSGGLRLAIAYRDAYAMLDTQWGSYVRDSERFLTLQLRLERN